MTFNDSPSLTTGNLGDLWLEGVAAYGAVVILANMTILYGSSSHSLHSLMIISGSVGAFFVLFSLFSYLQLSTLSHQFIEIITFPTYWLNLLFFFLVIFPMDTFFNFVLQANRDRQVAWEKERKQQDRKKFIKGLDPNKLAPIHRRKFLNMLIRI